MRSASPLTAAGSDARHLSPLASNDWVTTRISAKKGERRFVDTFDLSRSLADDTFTNQKATAMRSEFRTTPLMGLAGTSPFRTIPGYPRKDTVNGSALAGAGPAGTVTTSRKLTNAPLVVRNIG